MSEGDLSAHVPGTATELASAMLPFVGAIAKSAFELELALAKFSNDKPSSGLVRRAGARVGSVDGERLTKKQRREMKPARAPTEFNIFMKEETAKMRAANPEMKPTDVFSQCAKMWQEEKIRRHGPSGKPEMSTPLAMKDKHKKEKSHKKDKKKDK